jgi:hypothetical protein
MQVFFDKIELAGTGVKSVSGFIIRTQNALDVEECFRADDVEVFDRNNKKTSVTFSTHREHATPEAAFTFCVEHTAEVDGIGTIKIIGARGTRYLYGAGVDDCQGSYKGCSSTFRYSIIGGRISREVKK